MKQAVLPKIQATQKKAFPPLTKALRKLSVIVAHYLNKMGITPHNVLFFRVFVFGGGSLYFFYQENYLYNLIGLFLISLCYFFDLVDGDLARNHNQVTKMGGFLDGDFDAVVLNSIILTFTLRFFNGNYDVLYVIAGIFTLYGTIFSSRMSQLFEHKFSIGCGQGSKTIEEYLQENKFDRISTFFYGLMTPKGFPMTLLSNFRDYLLLGVIFQSMPLAILGFSIAINLRWIMLFSMTAWYYNTQDAGSTKISLFRLMKEIEVHK